MSGGGAAGGKTNLSKKEIDDILRFGTEELFNQVSWRVFYFIVKK
jgi:hypothetical protein